MKQKLKSQQGETLTEVLTAILVSAVSVALLFGGVMASSSIENKARTWDTDYYAALSAAEGRTEEAADAPADDFKVTVKGDTAPYDVGQKVDIKVYGKKGAWSFAVKPEETTP